MNQIENQADLVKELMKERQSQAKFIKEQEMTIKDLRNQLFQLKSEQ